MYDYAGALETVTEILKITRSSLDAKSQSQDPELARYLFALSSLHGKLGNEEQTVETFNESRQIVKNCPTKSDALVATLQ